jgi:elongation factor G
LSTASSLASRFEPVMRVEVVTPRAYMGGVIGDLKSRRARITGQDQRGNTEVINAMAPLANVFGYAGSLKSLSRGEASFTLQFSHPECAGRPGNHAIAIYPL